jgi:hypothetical protein
VRRLASTFEKACSISSAMDVGMATVSSQPPGVVLVVLIAMRVRAG